jgi:hypothetical protein
VRGPKRTISGEAARAGGESLVVRRSSAGGEPVTLTHLLSLRGRDENAAFSLLFSRGEVCARAAARHLGLYGVAGEEILAEAVERAWDDDCRAVQRADGTTDLGCWLAGVCRRVALEHRRSVGRGSSDGLPRGTASTSR